jgi:Protein of unknown function (DUF2721)
MIEALPSRSRVQRKGFDPDTAQSAPIAAFQTPDPARRSSPSDSSAPCASMAEFLNRDGVGDTFRVSIWLPLRRAILINGPASAEEEMVEYTLAADPFSILTVVVAPAVLTNASSVLALGTNNRLARVADRTHAVTAQLAKLEPGAKSYELLDAQLPALQTRAQLLLRRFAAFTWVSDCLLVRLSSRSPVLSRCITADDRRSRQQPELALYAEPQRSSHWSAAVS